MTTKTIARWIIIGALFLIPFLSLQVTNSLYFPFITGKNFTFRILVEIAFAGWIVLAVCDRRYRPRFSWTYAWYKSFVFWLLIADLLAVNVQKALWSNYERMDGWVTLIHLLVLLVVMGAVLSTENLWRKWWLTFVASSGLVSIYGVFQMLGWATTHQGATRVDASLGNAEYLAGYLMFSIIIALWQAFETRAKNQAWLKYSLFALALVEFIVLFGTGTRGTLIAIVAAAGFGSILWLIETGKQGRKGAIAVLAAILVIVGGLFMFRNAPFVQHNPNIQRLASVFELKDALGPRLKIWDIAVQGIHEKPVFGWGQEGYNYVFNSHYDPSLYSQEQWFDRAHDLFLDWAIAGGIPALILFLLVLLSAAWAIYKAPVSRIERVFLLSALVGYAVQGLVVFDNLFTYLPLVAILAMAHVMSSKPIALVEQASEWNDTRLDTLVAPIALVVGLLLVWFVNVPSIRASEILISALTPSYPAETRLAFFKQAVGYNGLAHQEIVEQLLSSAASVVNDQSVAAETKQQFVDYAHQEAEAEFKTIPEDARLHIQYATFYRAIGDLKSAQEQSAIAATYAPNKQNIIIEQGVDALQLGQFDAAMAFFTKAYELDTENKDPVIYIAATHISMKEVPEAKKVLQEAFGTTTINHPLLLLSYYQIKDWNDVFATMKLRISETNDAMTSFQLAAAYHEAGRNADAIAQIRATIAAHPEAAETGRMYLQSLGVKE